MTCRNCGKEMNAGETICGYCGTQALQSFQDGTDIGSERRVKQRKKDVRWMVAVMGVVVISLAVLAVMHLLGARQVKSDSDSFKSVLEENITAELVEIPKEESAENNGKGKGTVLVTMPNLPDLYFAVSDSKDCEIADVDELDNWMKKEFEASPERFLLGIEESVEVYYDGQQWQYDDITERIVREKVNEFLRIYLESLDGIEVELDAEALAALG